MRVALHAVLRDGREIDYETAHRVVPDDVLALLRRAGIEEWVIWRSGRHLFHLIEGDDLEGALAIIAADPIDATWQHAMDAYIERLEADPTGVAGVGLRHVWTLSEQDPLDHARDPPR